MIVHLPNQATGIASVSYFGEPFGERIACYSEAYTRPDNPKGLMFDIALAPGKVVGVDSRSRSSISCISKVRVRFTKFNKPNEYSEPAFVIRYRTDSQ